MTAVQESATTTGWDPEKVRGIVTDALAAHGVPTAAEVADVLVDTSLSGVHTHGVRLLAAYLDELRRGVAAAAAEPSIVRDTGPVVLLDGNGALGIRAGLSAARIAAERCARYGVGVVGVRNSNHFGAAGAYARKIAAEGLVGIATTSAASRVAPFGGIAPLFGTNPIAVAYGAEFCLDMATSQVCFGEIKDRARTGTAIPTGWATDAAGRATTDPAAATALAPLGGSSAHKGHGLAMMVTVLTAVLVGGPLDPQMPHIGTSADGRSRGVAHLLVAIDPDALGGRDAAGERLAHLVRAVRASAPADPDAPVLVPGDPQRAHRDRQARTGLDVDSETAALLRRLAAGGPDR